MSKVTLDSPREKIIKAWVEALRSGEYKQATACLFDGGGYCCLGVLCKVVGLEPSHGRLFDGCYSYLPLRVQEAVGLDNNEGRFGCSGLAVRNDFGSTFSEIADTIESRPAGLFIEEAAR